MNFYPSLFCKNKFSTALSTRCCKTLRPDFGIGYMHKYSVWWIITHICIFPPLRRKNAAKKWFLSGFLMYFLPNLCKKTVLQKSGNRDFQPVEKPVESVENSKNIVFSRGMSNSCLLKTFRHFLSSTFLPKNHFPRYAQRKNDGKKYTSKRVYSPPFWNILLYRKWRLK